MAQDIRTDSLPRTPEEQVMDVLLRTGAALGVLDLHAERAQSGMVFAARDLLRGYYEKMDAVAAGDHPPQWMDGVLRSMSLDLGYAIETIDAIDPLHEGGSEEHILYAVGHLLRSAREMAMGGAPAPFAKVPHCVRH